ncbi:SRPBCC family protein [Sphingobium sp. D43FB]|uniref:SRPBCC family protein n=1 Tax=Sphingobium sp. D43FB TaxID=2017595 RepID=UPI000BB55748|nr:SRPBCC family protein [Sphingobium sp. D43FB]PBN44180.1 polyketide cyclase [Sphingobium sp. D43FB]
MTDLPLHFEATTIIDGSAESVFAVADEPDLLTRHMSEPSLMMGGGSMQCKLDGLAGKAVGSVICLTGKGFGFAIALDEIIEERAPPLRKFWATIGTPQLVVIRDYRMGFEIAEVVMGCQLRVWIDYALPRSGVRHGLGRLLAPTFARWCVENMLHEVQSQHEGSAH